MLIFHADTAFDSCTLEVSLDYGFEFKSPLMSALVSSTDKVMYSLRSNLFVGGMEGPPTERKLATYRTYVIRQNRYKLLDKAATTRTDSASGTPMNTN